VPPLTFVVRANSHDTVVTASLATCLSEWPLISLRNHTPLI